jgi:hypothetical protein
VDGLGIVNALEDGEKLSSHGGGGCKAGTKLMKAQFRYSIRDIIF